MFFKLPPPLRGNKIFSIRTLALSSSSVMLNKNKNSAEEAKSIMVINKPSEPEQHVGHYERNFITAMRAMQEFHLKPENLVGLRVTTRRSPSENTPPIKVYWRKDVEAKSIQVWGSLEEMELEKQKLQLLESSDDKELVSLFKRVFHKRKGKQKQSFEREFWPIRGIRSSTDEGLSSGSGKVVLWAIGINSANCLAKGVAFVFTGSHAMYSEMIHSAADTMNQIVLAYGIKKSTQQSNTEHPYGYSNMPYVSSLISAVAIFFLGAGLSINHGIHGLSHPQELQSISLAAAILTGSLITETITMGLAIKSIKQSANKENMSFLEYVIGGYDPSVNTVLLEDVAAVLGVVIAGGSMGLSLHYGSHIPDAVGSIAIGGLLGSVALFMIRTNAFALVGRSIPEEKIQEINEDLEGDIMVRQIMDVKGMDMGNGIVRYKAEVDVDGRELARYYLSQQNIDSILAEIKTIECNQDLELFMLKHGESLVDCLGEQVDRIEKELKAQHPELRHVDLEVL